MTAGVETEAPATKPRRPSQAGFAVRMAAGSVASAARLAGGGVALVWRRAAALVAPVTSVISTIGWLVIVAALASLVLAGVLGWVEFAFVGATLLAALLVAVPFVFGRMQYAVTVALEPRRVVAGDRAMGRLEVRSTASRRSVPTRLELPVGAGLAEFVIPSLEPGAEHDELFAVPTQRRAVIVAGPAVSVRGDQLGLLRRTIRWSDPVELFVHPVTARLRSSAAGLVRDLEGETTKTITDHDISFHALRAYEPGDPLRNVHWRSSARTGRLMVRQYEETRRSQLVLLQSSERTHYSSDDEFELAVSVLASIAAQVVRDGTRIAVATEGGALRTATPTVLLDDTCRIERVDAVHRSLREFARTAILRLAPPSVAIVVAGSQVALPELRAVETVFPPDTQLIAIRVEQGAPARIGRVGDTTVVTVGELAELPGLMRRVQP